LEIEKTIERIESLKSEIDDAFEKGRIDLDRISAALESAVSDLESIRNQQNQEAEKPDIDRKIASSTVRVDRRPFFRIEDYR
jgi:predicted  nucleic acid-binding Zn-ribbon protein